MRTKVEEEPKEENEEENEENNGEEDEDYDPFDSRRWPKKAFHNENEFGKVWNAGVH